MQGMREVLAHGKVKIKLWKVRACNPSPGETKVEGSRVGGYMVRLCLKKSSFWRGLLMMTTVTETLKSLPHLSVRLKDSCSNTVSTNCS